MWFSRSDIDPLTPWRRKVLFLKLTLLYKGSEKVKWINVFNFLGARPCSLMEVRTR